MRPNALKRQICTGTCIFKVKTKLMLPELYLYLNSMKVKTAFNSTRQNTNFKKSTIDKGTLQIILGTSR